MTVLLTIAGIILVLAVLMALDSRPDPRDTEERRKRREEWYRRRLER